MSDDVMLLTVREAAGLLRISRNLAYEPRSAGRDSVDPPRSRHPGTEDSPRSVARD